MVDRKLRRIAGNEKARAVTRPRKRPPQIAADHLRRVAARRHGYPEPGWLPAGAERCAPAPCSRAGDRAACSTASPSARPRDSRPSSPPAQARAGSFAPAAAARTTLAIVRSDRSLGQTSDCDREPWFRQLAVLRRRRPVSINSLVSGDGDLASAVVRHGGLCVIAGPVSPPDLLARANKSYSCSQVQQSENILDSDNFHDYYMPIRISRAACALPSAAGGRQ